MQQSDKATGLSYAFRSNFLARECNYQIGLTAVYWTSGNRQGCIDFSDVKEVRFYRQFMPGEHALNRNIMWRVDLHCYSGMRIILSPMHYLRFRKWEDRSLRYRYFIDALVNQLRQNNPNLAVIYEHHWTLRLNRQINRKAGWVVGFFLLWVFKLSLIHI